MTKKREKEEKTKRTVVWKAEKRETRT